MNLMGRVGQVGGLVKLDAHAVRHAVEQTAVYGVAKGVGHGAVPRVGARHSGPALGQRGLDLLHRSVPFGAVARHGEAVRQIQHAERGQHQRGGCRARGGAGVLHKERRQQQHIQYKRMAGALNGAVHQQQRQKDDDRSHGGAALPEHGPPGAGIHDQADQRHAQQQEKQQVLSPAAVCQLVGQHFGHGAQGVQQLVCHVPDGGDHLPAGQLLQRAYIDIGKEVGRVEFGHQHERAAQGNRPARHADSDAAAVLPAQRQREQPEHGLIGAHERGHGAQHTQPRPRGAAFVPPRQNAAAQHRQHERIVQRLLHGGEHIADWRVHGGQRRGKGQLALPAKPRGPGEKRPAQHDEQQVAPQKGILPAQKQPRQRIDQKNRRPPRGVGADGGMRLIEAEVPLRCAVLHGGGQLLAVDDLVAPGADGQEDLRHRHPVDDQLIRQQEHQRGGSGAECVRPAGQGFTAHKIPGPWQ